jgi:hypothetical protein
MPTQTTLTVGIECSFNACKTVTAQATMEFEAGQPVQTGLTTAASDPWIPMYPG